MNNKPNPTGFTILELLIATTIFTLVLVLVTTGILQFTRQYYKGVISSNTQNTARAIIDDVTRAIQFNSGAVYPLYNGGPNPKGFCIGEVKRYSFAPLSQVTDTTPLGAHQHKYGLVTDSKPACSGLTSPVDVANLADLSSLAPGAREMLGAHMRVVKFDIAPVGNITKVTIRLAYGDDDLLCSPSVAGSCNPAANNPAIFTKDDLICKVAAGSQFCATSELNTTVTKRVQ